MEKEPPKSFGIELLLEKIKTAKTEEEKQKWRDVLDGKKSFTIGGRRYKISNSP